MVILKVVLTVVGENFLAFIECGTLNKVIEQKEN